MKREQVDIRPYTRQFFRGNGICIVLALVQTAYDTTLNLSLSWLLQQIIDLIAGENVRWTLLQLALLTVVECVLIIASYQLALRTRPRLVARGMAQYREYVYEQLSKKSISAFSGENTAVYVSALSNDAATIEAKYLNRLFVAIDMSVTCIAALIMMFWYSPILTLASVLLSLMPMLATVAMGKQVSAAEKEISDRNEDYISTLRDSLTGFSVIKSFQAEARMCKLFAQKVRRVGQAKEHRERLALIVEMLSAAASIGVQMGVLLLAAYLAISGKGVTAGTALIFVQLLNFVLRPISVLPGFFADKRASMELIRKLATALNGNVREEGQVQKRTLEQGIRLEALSYAYEPGKTVLKGIDFTFEAGKNYAIVGASGSGKSTLLNLLMASDHRYTGSILFDGTELQKISSQALYDLVSVVQQNVFIFNASIRDNITMFGEFPPEAVEQAVERSGLKTLITEKGENYLCGENGSGLSGGEKQRISIARSLLKNAQVLLVDEATAALDAQTAYQVSSAILDLQNLTRIVVTHTLDEGQLRRYDCILALKNGMIAEAGDFEKLMAEKGYFYSLFTVSQ